jgi:hypothetical protein
MQMSDSGEPFQNECDPIKERRESRSNATSDRDLHGKKQRSPSVATEEGMKIVESDEHRPKASA